jgi:hypothetical protein
MDVDCETRVSLRKEQFQGYASFGALPMADIPNLELGQRSRRNVQHGDIIEPGDEPCAGKRARRRWHDDFDANASRHIL